MISRLNLSVQEPRAGDERGIALQTIIVMVVLLAIAGTVAAVLLTRAGTETDRLQDETDRWSGITNETGCGIAGGVWTHPGGSGSCVAPGTNHHSGTSHTSHTTCHTSDAGTPTHMHAWTDNDTDGDGNPATRPTDGTCST